MNKIKNLTEQMQDFQKATSSQAVAYRVEVSVGDCTQTGVDAVWEYWENEDGKRDRPFGPAFTATSVQNGVVFRQEWYSNGLRHREDGPAIIVTDPETGETLDERYYNHGDQYFPTLLKKYEP